METGCNIPKTPIRPLIPADCVKADLTLDNILVLIYKAVVILSWAAEVIAVVLLIYSAVLYFTAYGDENKATTAKKIIIGVLTGVLIILLARWFMYIVTANIASEANMVDVNQLTLLTR